ncbi:hypothetical protein M433DRAFT_59436 [Acidomyces richmondensis BFW]|nr:hypothetical protein M433DRAFT_59436 [Acidomyces richmondensis BFW]
MDDQISTFCAFTSATPAQAQQYLALTDGSVEQAVELFFNNPDLGVSTPSTRPVAQPSGGRSDPIEVDDDDEVEMVGTRTMERDVPSVEDDEAMARRLQEEMYGGGGGSTAHIDPETGVRAPMARTTETLVGPGSGDWRDDPDQMNAAIFDQLRQRSQPRRAQAGIFNQIESESIWAHDDPNNPEVHRQVLSRATGGASEQTAKANLLADLFRPPFDLIAPLSWSDARDEGKHNQKWILINVQDPSIFDCQVLNRDIWKNDSIQETIREHFIFLQYNKTDPRGREYIQYYFANQMDNDDAYPHIAIVDPRTGEQVKTWSGAPGPKAPDFLMDLHEFLDRYSLSFEKKNPVQAKRKEKKKDIGQMSEEEQLEMALQNSLANGSSGPVTEDDPDSLTQPAALVNGKGKDAAPMPEIDTPFSRISSSNPHVEPPSTAPDTTRIQFRYSGGRVVRRFLLADPIRRIYEWLKTEPLAGTGGKPFELIAMGKNLIDILDLPIGEAGLRNGTVMVETVSDDADDEA